MLSFSWDAYNESSDMDLQVRLYQKRFGFLPAKVYADKSFFMPVQEHYKEIIRIKMIGDYIGMAPNALYYIFGALLFPMDWLTVQKIE